MFSNIFLKTSATIGVNSDWELISSETGRPKRDYLIGIVGGLAQASESARQLGFITIAGLNQASLDAQAWGDASLQIYDDPFANSGADFIAWLVGNFEGMARGLGLPQMLNAVDTFNPGTAMLRTAYNFLFESTGMPLQIPSNSEVLGSLWSGALNETGIADNEIYEDTVPGMTVGMSASSLITPYAAPHISRWNLQAGERIVNSVRAGGARLSIWADEAAAGMNNLLNGPGLPVPAYNTGGVYSGGSGISIARPVAPTASEAIAVVGGGVQIEWLAFPVLMMMSDNSQPGGVNDDGGSNGEQYNDNADIPEYSYGYDENPGRWQRFNQNDLKRVSGEFGISRQELRDVIHAMNEDLGSAGARRNPDYEVNFDRNHSGYGDFRPVGGHPIDSILGKIWDYIP